jgi:ACS family hexuronate transporter-like MFS transporter
VSRAPDPQRWRWFVLAVFVLSSAINFLDRLTLATVAPRIRDEFHLSGAEYGMIVAAFQITYAVSAPFAGMWIDRVGLNRAASIAVGLWSCAGISTGFTRGLAGLVACRSALGIPEAAGIPAAGKAIYQYLRPAERALGHALNQGGVSLGMVLAPPLATSLALQWGWRSAFVVTGLLGLAWIPAWNLVARRASAAPVPKPAAGSGAEMLRDPRLWAFVAANAVSMVGYTLWSNWTTLYLVDVQRLSFRDAASYAWIPPVFAAVGGLAGGWLSKRLVDRGVAPPAARLRICVAAAALAVAGAAIPAAPSAAWASAGISLSFFAILAFSVNMYALPLDVFGGARAAFAVSMLTASVGAISAVVAPPIGYTIDRWGYAPAIVAASLMPLAAAAILWSTRSAR